MQKLGKHVFYCLNEKRKTLEVSLITGLVMRRTMEDLKHILPLGQVVHRLKIEHEVNYSSVLIRDIHIVLHLNVILNCFEDVLKLE